MVAVVADRPPTSIADRLNAALAESRRRFQEIQSIALVSDDGLIIASSWPNIDDSNKFGAMAATLLSLASRSSYETGRGKLEELVVRGASGYAVLTDAGKGVFLLGITEEVDNLGLLLVAMRASVSEINDILWSM